MPIGRLQKQTEMLNRAFARITQADSTKANGELAPAWKVPEAVEYVSGLDGQLHAVPGADTPLTWAAASLFGAARQYLAQLERLEG